MEAGFENEGFWHECRSILVCKLFYFSGINLFQLCIHEKCKACKSNVEGGTIITFTNN